MGRRQLGQLAADDVHLGQRGGCIWFLQAPGVELPSSLLRQPFCFCIYTIPQYSSELARHAALPEEKKKVLARVRRIRGQCDALDRALEAGADCGPVLQQIAAIRGAVNGLMSEVMEAHLREEFGQPAASDEQRAERVRDMSALIRSYLK